MAIHENFCTRCFAPLYGASVCEHCHTEVTPVETLDYWYLCFNCGFCTPYEKWGSFQTDLETGELRPSQKDEDDPILVCPVCLWHHTDDDGNPGIQDGTRNEVSVAREAAKAAWAAHWADVAEEIFLSGL